MKTVSFTSAQNVAIEYELAAPIQRAAAALIDGVLIGLYILLILIVAGSAGVENFRVVELLLIKFPWIFYHPVLEHLTQGQTLGKYLLGIRVVTYMGERPGLREIFTRWIFKGYFLWIGFSFASFLGGTPELFMMGLVQLTIGLVGFFYASISERRQRVGDVMAGTLVIRNRSGVRYGLRDVLAIKTSENHTPVYPNAVRFTDEDMLLIKNTIQRVRANPNDETKRFAVELADRSAALIGLEETPEKRLQFLQTLLQDYVVLTRG
jgi:uncharacterized RDD family membrane protein YckC